MVGPTYRLDGVHAQLIFAAVRHQVVAIDAV